MQYLSGYNIAYDREYSQERFEMAPGAAGDAAARMTKDTSAVKSTESCMFGDKKIVDTLHWGLLYILVGLLHFGLFHESARSGPASFGQGFSKLKVWHRRDIAFNMYSMAVMSCMVIYQRLTHYANESAIEASNHRHDSIFNIQSWCIRNWPFYSVRRAATSEFKCVMPPVYHNIASISCNRQVQFSFAKLQWKNESRWPEVKFLHLAGVLLVDISYLPRVCGQDLYLKWHEYFLKFLGAPHWPCVSEQ